MHQCCFFIRNLNFDFKIKRVMLVGDCIIDKIIIRRKTRSNFQTNWCTFFETYYIKNLCAEKILQKNGEIISKSDTRNLYLFIKSLYTYTYSINIIDIGWKVLYYAMLRALFLTIAYISLFDIISKIKSRVHDYISLKKYFYRKFGVKITRTNVIAKLRNLIEI